jgi:NADH dehydrogenase
MALTDRDGSGAASAGAPHRVIVVGGGFGGLQAALKLARMPVEVTVIDRQSFHLFQPLAYQVATGSLSADEICYSLRRVFRPHRNVRVVLAEVTDIDLAGQRVGVRAVIGEDVHAWEHYDTLILAGGAEYSYFGHDEWRSTAVELKSLDGALMLRRRILGAFEAAELESDPEQRAAWLTFVVVGGGPTGVEMAGQIPEIAQHVCSEYRSLKNHEARVVLVEAGDRVLSGFPPSLSVKAKQSLEEIGATVWLSQTVVGLDDRSVTLRTQDGASRHLATRTVVWAAGVVASELAGTLAQAAGLETDRAGRLGVLEDLSVPGHPEVLAIGDMVYIQEPDGTPLLLPGLAPVAMQQGRHAAGVVGDRLRGRPGRPFRYRDKGNLATIGRARAVADINGLKVSGFPAWLIWVTVHLWYLIGVQNRLLVLVRWAFSFFTGSRGAGLIIPPSAPGSSARRGPPSAVDETSPDPSAETVHGIAVGHPQ